MDTKDFERVLKLVLDIYDITSLLSFKWYIFYAIEKSEHDNIPTLFPY